MLSTTRASLLPGRLLGQQSFEFGNQRSFVITRKSHSEEAVKPFAEQSFPRFFLVAGIDGEEQRSVRARGRKVSGRVSDHQHTIFLVLAARLLPHRHVQRLLELVALNPQPEPPAPWKQQLAGVAEFLVKRSVWIVGGDGWAYDIGYGGLDHVIASGRNVNILVLDTEVYSNTGGQASKATPIGASAKFAMAGKAIPKKDLGMIAMAYGSVYVAHVAFGAKDAQTVKAFQEADSYDGPSIIIAFSHCIAHGYDLERGLDQQKLAVDTGYWPLYRFDPRRLAAGENPLMMDSQAPKADVGQFMANETRFRVVQQQNPARYNELLAAAQREVTLRTGIYEQLAKLAIPTIKPSGSAE